jgi:hypothetical protein
MLQDMRNTRVIGRVGLEPDGEDIVAVISGNVEMLRASLVVLQVQRSQLELWDVLGSQQCEAVELVAGFRQLGKLCNCSPSRTLRSISKHPDRPVSANGPLNKTAYVDRNAQYSASLLRGRSGVNFVFGPLN